MKFTKIAAAAIAASMMAGGAVSAATVTFKNEANGTGSDRFTVTCDISCQGYLFDSSTFTDFGGMIEFQDGAYAAGNGSTWEKNLLETASGETFTDFSKTEEDPGNTFTSTARYILFKVGKNMPDAPYDVGILFNDSGFSQGYSYAKADGVGGTGLSHIAEAGKGLTAVPLPAAGWMLLAGLGGLAALRRRKSV